MNVLLDSNVLVSAALFPDSIPYQAYLKATTDSLFDAVVCEQNIYEMIRVFNRKFPSKLVLLNAFLSSMLGSVNVLPIPQEIEADEDKIRDETDRPILRTAKGANVDIIVTGDKDFLESGIKRPMIMTPTEFLSFLEMESGDSDE